MSRVTAPRHLAMLGILAGSSLFKSALFKPFTPRRLETSYGGVTLYDSPETTAGSKAVFCQRHDTNGQFTPPHRINYRGNLKALKQAGVTRIVAFYSVGGLHKHLPPGTLVMPTDYISSWTPVTFFEGPDIQWTTPVLDPSWHRTVHDVVARLEPKVPLVPHGVYAHTPGPRFETKAEVRMLARDADVVGMTGGMEASLACELHLPFAMVCMVDNFAHGVVDEPLSQEAVHKAVEANRGTLERAVTAVYQALAFS